jgi:heme exporter protein D
MELWGVVPILVFGVLYIGIIAGIITVIVIVLKRMKERNQYLREIRDELRNQNRATIAENKE